MQARTNRNFVLFINKRERGRIVKVKKYAGMLIALCCLFGVLQLCPFSLFANTKETTDKGNTIMKQLAARDVAEIESNIQTIQNQFIANNQDVGSFASRFANTFIMGDSLAEGLIEYNIMPSNIVIAERGKRTDNIDDEIQLVIQNAPKAIFMEYGINDLGYCRGDAQLFASQYREQVIKIKKALPKTKIYINSLTPISEAAQKNNPHYTHVNDFNQALQAMCKELKLTYIDNTHTIDFREDVYEYDGVHPSYPYYPLWLANMLKAAGL